MTPAHLMLASKNADTADAEGDGTWRSVEHTSEVSGAFLCRRYHLKTQLKKKKEEEEEKKVMVERISSASRG